MRFQIIIVKISLVSILMFGTANGFSQAFLNLDFESANLMPIPTNQFGGSVPINAGLPGWTGFLGSQQTTQVLQNNLTTGEASIDIFGPNFSMGIGGIIEGNYTAVLQAGGSGTHVAATIEQSGTVPGNAESIQMKLGPGATGFAVSLGGQSITLLPLESTADYTLYGGAIPSSLDGLVEELSISALPTAQNPFNGFTLDSIVFSPSLVPEPSTWALMLCGAGLFGLMRRKNRA